MKVVDPIFVTPAAVPPVMPVAAEAARPIREGVQAARDRREAGQQPQDKGTSFRAALDAATLGGLGEAFAAFSSNASTDTAALRPERRPGGRVEIDATEAEGLYRAAQRPAAPAMEPHHAREYLAASREYAQRFFSVGGTYASRGETLELRA